MAMVPIHLLSARAAEIDFSWNPVNLSWSRPCLPPLSHLAGPIQHFKTAVLDAWRNKGFRFSGRALAGCSWLNADP